MCQTVPAIPHCAINVLSHGAIPSDECHIIIRFKYLATPSVVWGVWDFRKVIFCPGDKIEKMSSIAFRAFHTNLVVLPSDNKIAIFWITMSGFTNIYVWISIVVYKNVVISVLRHLQCDAVGSPERDLWDELNRLYLI